MALHTVDVLAQQSSDTVKGKLNDALRRSSTPESKIVINQAIQMGPVDLLVDVMEKSGWSLQEFCLNRIIEMPKTQAAGVFVQILEGKVFHYRNEQMNIRTEADNALLQAHVIKTIYKLLDQPQPVYHGLITRAEANALIVRLRALH